MTKPSVITRNNPETGEKEYFYGLGHYTFFPERAWVHEEERHQAQIDADPENFKECRVEPATDPKFKVIHAL